MAESLDIIFEWVIFTLSVIFIFIGFGGIIMVVTTYPYRSDITMQYAYTFVYLYMLVLGILLFVYRKKIVVKK